MKAPSNSLLVEGHRAVTPPEGVPIWDIDPFDEAILAYPRDFYRELRAQGPFAWIPRYASLMCGRHAETEEVFSDHARFVSSRGVGLQDFKLEEPWRPPSMLLEADPPEHTRARKVMTRALSPRVVKGLRDYFNTEAQSLVDKLVEKENFDAVTDLAEVFPTTVVPAAIGLKENNPEFLVAYGAMVFDTVGPDNEIRRRAMAQAPKVVPWISEACTRAKLLDGHIGADIHDAVATGELNDNEAAMLVRSLFSAGLDTTIAAISSAVWCLANHEEAFAALREDTSLAKPCFEEVIRFTSPVHTFCRTANVDAEVAGVTIEADTKIICSLAAANLDEEKWPGADTFDISRKPIGHLAFGSGIHRCVGQTIARAEVEAILVALAKRVKKIEVTGPATWRPSNAINGLATLPIRLTR